LKCFASHVISKSTHDRTANPAAHPHSLQHRRYQHGRPVQFGLARGSADLIGYRTITITPEMVGQQVAVFASIEVKTPTGRIRPEQQAWLDTIQAAGGIAGVARSVEDALRIMTAQG
jgi:hypothetical protein